MSKTIIHTDKAPAAIGAYSQAVRAGDTVYMSGQIPLDPATMTVVGNGDFRAEARHYFVSGTAQVSRPHVVVDTRYAPRKAFLAVGFEERAGLRPLYRGRIHHRIGFIPIPCQHLVSCVAQAFVSFLTMRACAVRKVGVQLVVFFLGHKGYCL